MRMIRRFGLGVAAAALVSLGITVPAAGAFAQSCTSGSPPNTCSGSGTVTGVVTIPVTLTLTLSGSGFDLTATAGQPSQTSGWNADSGQPITATVDTNDAGGYTLSESLGGGQFTGTKSDSIPASDVGAEQWNAPGNLAGSSTFNGSNPLTLATSSTASSSSGDQYGLAYQVTPPANSPPDVYTGTFTVSALAA